MRNPATTSAEDFTLIEKDPDGDYIWFRFKGAIRIGVFYVPPNLKLPPWTFQRSGLGSGNSIIDYIAVTAGPRAATNPLTTERQTPIDSDHKLIWTEVGITITANATPAKNQPFSHGRLRP
ncbi:hypothetical protein BC829DRAFT_450302 [Chytridium lagenaria]|nr:hypothetical protein BC829DRAFT_450302 [Chytridium lagenaria]